MPLLLLLATSICGGGAGATCVAELERYDSTVVSRPNKLVARSLWSWRSGIESRSTGRGGEGGYKCRS